MCAIFNGPRCCYMFEHQHQVFRSMISGLILSIFVCFFSGRFKWMVPFYQLQVPLNDLIMRSCVCVRESVAVGALVNIHLGLFWSDIVLVFSTNYLLFTIDQYVLVSTCAATDTPFIQSASQHQPYIHHLSRSHTHQFFACVPERRIKNALFIANNLLLFLFFSFSSPLRRSISQHAVCSVSHVSII